MSTSSPAEPSTDVPPPKQHIKRPPNAWVIYRQVKSKEYREAHPDRKFTLPEMSGIMSKQWAGEPEEEIRRFEQLANEKLSELLKRHPEYRYQPRSRGSGDKQKKLRKVKDGRVAKPKRTKKGEATLTATEATTTEATNVGHERPEANGPVLASSGVFGLGPLVLLHDQCVLTNANHIFCDNTTFPFNNFNAAMLNCGAQPMAAGSGQVAMQPFATSQVNAYRLMSNGGTIVSNGRFHTGGSFQFSNPSQANALYEQMTKADVAAGPSVLYTTTSRNDDSSNCFNFFEYPTPDFTHAVAPGNEQVSLDATVNAIQDLNAVFENLANFLAFDRDYMAWGG